MSSLMFKLTGTHLIPVQDQTSYLAVPEAWGNFSVLCQTSAGICLTDLIWEGISFPLYHSYGIQKNLIHLASQLGKQVNTNHAMCRASLIMSQNVKKMCFSKLQIKTVMAWFKISTCRNLVTSVMTALKTNSSFSLSNQPNFVIREKRVTRPWKV